MNIWIENHQKKDIHGFDDKPYYKPNINTPDAENIDPGIYMYTTKIGNDRSTPNVMDPFSLVATNFIKIFNFEGNWDIYWDGGPLLNVPFVGPSYVFSKALENPISGQNNWMMVKFDKNNDGLINVSYSSGNSSCNLESTHIWAEEINSQPQATYARTGKANQAFVVGSEVGLSGIVPILNYPTYNNLADKLGAYKLNGLTVKITGFNSTTGEYTLDILFDDFEIRDDKRWCGDIELLSNSGNYSADLQSGKTIWVDKSGTPNRRNEVTTGSGDFADPTILFCKSGSYFHMETNSTVIVDNNSTLKLEPGSKFEVEDGAIVYVRNGGKLLIEDGAELIVNGTGKVYIESTGSIIYDGGDIILTDDNSILEIAGVLDIQANRTFTFTGDGFIRFNIPPNPGVWTNITAASTSAIHLEGSTKSDKIIEVLDGSWVSPPDNMSSFTIKNGTVKLGEYSYIGIGAQQLELRNLLVTNLTGSGFVHDGIYVNGQSSHFITGLEIENGNYGLTARNFYTNGADVTIYNSHIHNNDIGLRTYSKGARLVGVELSENEIGWLAVGMDRPTNTSFVNIHDNAKGIVYSANGSGSLYMYKSHVDRNLFNGIEFIGPSLLTARCGSVSANLESGYRMGKFSFLNLSNSGLINLKAGFVDVTDNYYSMNFMPNSSSALFEYGYNNFAIDPNLSPYPLIGVGEMDNGCSHIIHSLNNQWFHGNLNPPLPNGVDTDIHTDGNLCYPVKPITLQDLQPVYKPGCPTEPIEPDPGPDPTERSPLMSCEECPLIDIDYLGTTLPFNDAVIAGINHTVYADSLNGDDVVAMDIFYNIVTRATEYFDHEKVQWLSEYAYYFMKQAMGSGVSRGTIGNTTQTASFEKLNEIQNLLIELAINYDDPMKQFMYRFDNAMLYNLVDERQTALAILAEAEACIELDEDLRDWLNQWRAHINAVDLIVSEEYHVMEYDNLYLDGYNNGWRVHAGLGVAKRDTVIQSSTAFSNVGSQTANDHSENQYFISSVVKDSLTDFLIVKYDASTNILWSDTIGGWSRGADTARIVIVDDWDNVYMSGQAWNGSNYDVMTVKYDSTGAKQWIAMHNSSEKWHDIPYGITVDTSGYVYIALQSTSDSGSYHSMITYSQCNCPTGARLANQTLPENNTTTNYLETNLEVYPNPANKQLTISFTDRENQISVKMINALGQDIYKNNFNGVLDIDVSVFPKGVYLIHLEEKSGGTKTVKKILLQ